MSEQATASIPLAGSERLLTSMALSIATFMQALDSSIANVAIPTLSGDLGVSPTQGTWVITSYSVSMAISVPLTGWLARRVGEVRLFTIAVLLFTLASWGCGMSNSIGMLIACRVLQGAMAGPMTPMAQTLLLSIYPPAKKGTALGLFSMTVLVAPVLGPLLGGWITDHMSWSWIFFVNLPIGLFCAYICWRRLHSRESKIVRSPIDAMGLALLVIGVGCVQIMLDEGRELDWFNSPQIVLLAAVGVTALAALIIWELTAEHPIIDLHLFEDRNFTMGTIVMSCVFLLHMGIVVIIPLWLQTQLGYTASWAGLVMAPTGVLAMILMPLVGRNLHRLNVQYMVSGSLLLMATCCFLRSGFNTDVTFGHILMPQWLQGIATGCVLIPLTGLILSNIKPHHIASASGLTTFCRTLASSMGTSISTTLWDRRASIHHATLTENISNYNSVFAQGFTTLKNMRGYAMLEGIVNQQSYMAATVDIFWLYAWLFVIAAPLIWFAKSAKPSSEALALAE